MTYYVFNPQEFKIMSHQEDWDDEIQRRQHWNHTKDRKESNPKDSAGDAKAPIHLWPPTATIAGAVALEEGRIKYGRSNWRVIGVRFSVYYSACNRHLMACMDGEWVDPDSGLPHLWKALACLAILIDAEAKGILIDDRNYPNVGTARMLEEAKQHVERLREKFKGVPEPKHYTIEDSLAGEQVELP